MIVTITIKDETYQKYVGHDPNNPRLAITQQIERYQDVSPKDRVVVLSPETRRQIEALYGKAIEDGQKFVDWIKELLTLKLGEETVTLKAGQLKRLRGMAKFYKQHPGGYIASTVARLVQERFGSY